MYFAQLWNLLFSGKVDDITFLITSNKRMADEVHTILFMVIGKDLKFLLIHVLTMTLIQFANVRTADTS